MLYMKGKHDEHIRQFHRYLRQYAQYYDTGNAWKLFDDHTMIIVSDLLEYYISEHHMSAKYEELPTNAVNMYAQGMSSHKKLPVELILVGSFVRKMVLTLAQDDIDHYDLNETYSVLRLFENGFIDNDKMLNDMSNIVNDYIGAIQVNVEKRGSNVDN